MAAVISQGLSKRYRLGEYVFTGRSGDDGGTDRWLWALRDVSFEVGQGEVLGIVGRNGAGKTTLLKLLARITRPTSGRAVLEGRLGALLEVGTGFHPELTGRDNIYLNGAILGMGRAEIASRFDEIVQFAGIERFLDTPLKRYSSGMYVRLAFAVAAHLEPEILVVDEVLAVGDTEFQKKCLGRMSEVASEGRTVLFVSHNLLAVRKLCTSALLLEQGAVEYQGDVAHCLKLYLGNTADEASARVDLRESRQNGSGEVEFLEVAISDPDGRLSSSIAIGEPFDVSVRFRLNEPVEDLLIGLAVHGSEDLPIFSTHWNDLGDASFSLEPGEWETKVRIDPNHLRHGRYTISLGAIRGIDLLGRVEAACSFDIAEVVLKDDFHYDHRVGEIFVPMTWAPPVPAR